MILTVHTTVLLGGRFYVPLWRGKNCKNVKVIDTKRGKGKEGEKRYFLLETGPSAALPLKRASLGPCVAEGYS